MYTLLFVCFSQLLLIVLLLMIRDSLDKKPPQTSISSRFCCCFNRLYTTIDLQRLLWRLPLWLDDPAMAEHIWIHGTRHPPILPSVFRHQNSVMYEWLNFHHVGTSWRHGRSFEKCRLTENAIKYGTPDLLLATRRHCHFLWRHLRRNVPS